MKLRKIGTTALVTAGITVFPAISMAAAAQSCMTGEPTAQSSTWNFNKEASQLLKSVRADAMEAENSADRLTHFAALPAMSWESHATELQSVKTAVNDMGDKLCRLQAIRQTLEPWEQKAVDRVVPLARMAAGNAEDAIKFLRAHQGDFWLPDYRKYVDDIYTETARISNSVKQFQEYARVHRKDMNLGETLGMGAGSM